MKVPDNIFTQICTELEAAEQSGELDDLFKREIHTPGQVSKCNLLHSFNTGMRLYKSTFKKVLGYEMTWPGFAEEALIRLEELGCSRAREYYEAVRSEWQQEYDAQMKNVAHWYRDFSEQEFEKKRREVKEEHWRQKEAELSRKKLRLLKQKQEALNEKLKLLRQKQAAQSMTKESSDM